ncbi:hypothetical protein O181_004618 [Austropuccinia psidii MF-1]|uniref:Uncharacterized protein n=1 Tax=Austropuccinia psidii MF-1 TaxID=1389203 RepID=A0A9Q3GEQ6_9BASI|nr:hypothetical protein [Austropuccinia psidii MF-1]
MLMLLHHPQDMPLRKHPHIFPQPILLTCSCSCCTLTPPYDSSHLPNPLRRLPYLCSLHALPTCLQRLPHTGLILKTTYHPYAPSVPSRCDYN